MKWIIAILLTLSLIENVAAQKVFNAGDPLLASDLNENFDEQNKRITDIESKTGGSSSMANQPLTGIVSIGSGSTQVNGVGTLFSQELNVGDAIVIADEAHSIASITNDTELFLDAPQSVGAVDVNALTDNDLLNIKNSTGSRSIVVDKSGNVSTNGFLTRRIARATGLGPVDDANDGQLVSRVLSISKIVNETSLRIGYTDNFRMLGYYMACRWEIRVDGKPCPNSALVYDFFSANGDGATSNDHHSGHVVGYCDGITTGQHEIQVWVSETPSSTNAYVGSDCYTGWSSSRWTLEAEEVY